MNKILNNVSNPTIFKAKLEEIIDSIYDLFELTREHEFNPAIHGNKSFDGMKTGNQVSDQFDRPTEFLQTLVDIIRVHYEPLTLGSFFLNANIGFLIDEIPSNPFKLAYASLTSSDNQSFNEFWNNEVTSYLNQCSYDLCKATNVYVVATTGRERYGSEYCHEIAKVLGSGFSTTEVIQLLSSTINDNLNPPEKQIHSGYCLDPVLEKKIRISLWAIFPEDCSTI